MKESIGYVQVSYNYPTIKISIKVYLMYDIIYLYLLFVNLINSKIEII